MYKDVWEAVLDEVLPCQKELGNPADPFTVEISGHVPKKISSIFVHCSYKGMGHLHVVLVTTGDFLKNCQKVGLKSHAL